ncbi:MAG: DNA-directed DNA polymerase I [Sulfolobales archaeon]
MSIKRSAVDNRIDKKRSKDLLSFTSYSNKRSGSENKSYTPDISENIRGDYEGSLLNTTATNNSLRNQNDTVVSTEVSTLPKSDSEKDPGEKTSTERRIKIIEVDKISPEPIRPPEEITSVDDGFILDVSYDGDSRRAIVYIYDDKNNKLLIYRDRSNHKPYFYVDLPPPKVKEIIGSDKAFIDAYSVEKIDLLRRERVKRTKIVVQDPLAVRRLRDKFEKYWEANIKYHHNYIYDMGIIPGMRHKILNGKFTVVYQVSREEIAKEIDKIFAEERREVREIAIDWYMLFEDKPPKIRRAAIDIEVYTPIKTRVPNPKYAEYPIVSISLCDNEGNNIVFVLMREGIGSLSELEELDENTVVRIYRSERDLLLDFFKFLQNYPVIITFNGDAFDLPYLYERALRLGISKDFIPIAFKETHATLRTGLHVDLYKFFRNKSIQNYALEGKYKEFTLDAIATSILGVGKIAHEEGVGRMSIGKLVKYNLRDAQLTLELTRFQDELIWRLIILIMRISKLGLEDVTRTQVSAWIKSLFYWEHRKNGYFIPSEKEIREIKNKKSTEATIKGKKYAGAIVIDPPQGVFFKVSVLDFASLYPSIIKRFNLSYETIDPAPGECKDVREIRDEKNQLLHEVCMDYPGITSIIIGLLRDFRVKIFKKKSKAKDIDPLTKSWYDVVQRALKVYVNAAYGVFGHENFPLYAVPVAESVTALGRKIITDTMRKAEELGLLVLYGDTDSLFLWDPDQEKLNQLREWVLKEYGLELEVDKEFRFVAFSLKKNYFGVTTQGGIEIKGLVGKKKNTPKFVKQAFIDILQKISSVERPEEIIKVREWIRDLVKDIYNKLRNYEYTLDELSFTVMLSKDVKEYTKNTPQHVKAAMMLMKENIQVSAGDNITFVKVRGKEGVKPIQLAKVSEIDIDKYIEILRTALEQVMAPLSIEWEEISGSIMRLHNFINQRGE